MVAGHTGFPQRILGLHSFRIAEDLPGEAGARGNEHPLHILLLAHPCLRGPLGGDEVERHHDHQPSAAYHRGLGAEGILIVRIAVHPPVWSEYVGVEEQVGYRTAVGIGVHGYRACDRSGDACDLLKPDEAMLYGDVYDDVQHLSGGREEEVSFYRDTPESPCRKHDAGDPFLGYEYMRAAADDRHGQGALIGQLQHAPGLLQVPWLGIVLGLSPRMERGAVAHAEGFRDYYLCLPRLHPYHALPLFRPPYWKHRPILVL